jgi:uncharacterized protein YbjT (DUF2867 family)
VGNAALTISDENLSPPARALRVAVWGGTGAAGAEVLRQCRADTRIGEVVAFTRRPLAEEHRATPQVFVSNFLDMSPHRRALQGFDAVYWCLGVSQLAEPNTQAYRVVTRDYAVAAAEALREESPSAVFHFLSGMGAARNGFSPVMWGRVKGEAERALQAVGLRRLVVWRPTFIHSVAGRERPTRGDRLAEALGFRVIPLLTNSTVNIAQAMLHTTFSEDGDATHGPWNIERFGRAYRRAREQDKGVG